MTEQKDIDIKNRFIFKLKRIQINETETISVSLTAEADGRFLSLTQCFIVFTEKYFFDLFSDSDL